MVMYADADEYFKQQTFSMISEEVNFCYSRLEGNQHTGTLLYNHDSLSHASHEA